MSGREPNPGRHALRRALKRFRGTPEPAPVRTAAPSADVDPDADVALNATIPWDALAARPRDAGTVSVIVPTYRDIDLTTAAVRAVAADAAGAGAMARSVQIVIVDNGCAPRIADRLDALAAEVPGAEVLHNSVNHGFALGNNLALPSVRGRVVVFLNNDTEVRPGWLEPLVEALQRPGVVGAQSLLVYPTGEIQSAGIAFPTGGGVPHALLAGQPVAAAQGLREARLQAATAAALAMRTEDVLALRGFDPVFRNGMEDADLGLRAGRDLGGHFVLCPDSVVVHHESKTPGRYTHAMRNRRQFLDRWADSVVADDTDLWGRAGFEVTGHECKPVPGEVEELWQPIPVVRPV